MKRYIETVKLRLQNILRCETMRDPNKRLKMSDKKDNRVDPRARELYDAYCRAKFHKIDKRKIDWEDLPTAWKNYYRRLALAERQKEESYLKRSKRGKDTDIKRWRAPE